MDLLEYQAKKLFRQVGIPILPSQTIKDPRQIKQLQIPYPVVLKSQVRTGGRGKAGGIKFVANTIDAIAAARNIFNLSILGEYPEVILAEARYDAHRELFLAIALDYQLKRPVILGSSSGGMDVKLLLKNLQQVVIKTEFSPFYARRLAYRMQLSGNLLLAVSDIIVKMYALFQEKDLDFVEINPLGVNSEGQLMALDGKMTINKNALSKHPDIVTLSKSVTIEQNKSLIAENDQQKISKVQCLNWQNYRGNVAIITNDRELSILGWDLISQAKKKPALGIFIDYALQDDNEETAVFCAELTDVFYQLQSFDNIKVIFINLWAAEKINQAIAQTIFDYSLSLDNAQITAQEQDQSQAGTSIKFIVRLLGEKIESYQETFNSNDIYWTNSLEEAISQI